MAGRVKFSQDPLYANDLSTIMHWLLANDKPDAQLLIEHNPETPLVDAFHDVVFHEDTPVCEHALQAADEVDPADDVLPAPQTEQVPEPAPLYVPAGQVEQEAFATPLLYFPAAQFVHVFPDKYFPGPQAVHFAYIVWLLAVVIFVVVSILFV